MCVLRKSIKYIRLVNGHVVLTIALRGSVHTGVHTFDTGVIKRKMNNTQFHHCRYYFIIIIDALCEPIPPQLRVVPIQQTKTIRQRRPTKNYYVIFKT